MQVCGRPIPRGTVGMLTGGGGGGIGPGTLATVMESSCAIAAVGSNTSVQQRYLSITFPPSVPRSCQILQPLWRRQSGPSGAMLTPVLMEVSDEPRSDARPGDVCVVACARP